MKGIYEHKVRNHVYFRAMGFFQSHRFILYQGKSKKAATSARRNWEKNILPNLTPKTKVAQVRKLLGAT